MKFIHHVFTRAASWQMRQLMVMGIVPKVLPGLPGEGDPLIVFDVDEADPRSKTILAILSNWGVSTNVRTTFSPGEVAAAEWCEVAPTWHHGYPGPDWKGNGYRSVTYDTSKWCPKCGIGFEQKAPFVMIGEPNWRNKGILQLNWVFDQYFVHPDVWSSVFQPLGISCRDVHDHHGQVLRSVRQLVIEESASIDGTTLTATHCSECARPKYSHVVRGGLPLVRVASGRNCASTREYFGSGASAGRAVLFSQALVLRLANVRGVEFRPVARVEVTSQDANALP